MNILNTISTGIDMADMAWEAKCREEDLIQRDLDNRRRKIDDSRRSVNEKAEQLKAVGSLSALIAGFAMVVQTNVSIPNDLNDYLLYFVGLVTAGVVASMLIAMINATFILIAIYKYDCFDDSQSFDSFWKLYCEDDWKLAFNSFTFGIPLFLIMLSLVAWIVFWQHPSRNVASSLVTVVSSVTLLFYIANTWYKWSDFLRQGHQKYSITLEESGRQQLNQYHGGSDYQHGNGNNNNNNNGEDIYVNNHETNIDPTYSKEKSNESTSSGYFLSLNNNLSQSSKSNSINEEQKANIHPEKNVKAIGFMTPRSYYT